MAMVEFELVKRWVFIACCKREIKVVDGFGFCVGFISPSQLDLFARVSVMSLFDRMLERV